MSAHVLTAPGLAVDRPVWLLDCSCGREFEHADLIGVQRLGSRHLVAQGAAFLLTLAVALPPGRDPAGVTEEVMRALEIAFDDAVLGRAATVHSIEGGPS